MSMRPTRLIWIVIVPALIYAALKGFVYYKAKTTVDDAIVAAADQAEIHYTDISTDLRGIVTVSGITVQPVGYEDRIAVEAVRVSSDDPMFFVQGARWQPGENAPPPSMSFAVFGLSVPLDADLFAAAAPTGAQPCENGLQVDPQLLRQIGFSQLSMDFDGSYRLNEADRSLDVAMNFDIHDIESVRLGATLADVDAEYLGSPNGPPPSFARLNMAMRVAPEFGRQLLKTCAIGTDATIEAWSERLADRALREFELFGVELGSGLEAALRRFYRDWGEFELVAAPSEPVGMLSLLFLPPDQWVDALGMRLTVNGELITDTRFTWQRPDAAGLAALFGAGPAEGETETTARPQRIIVRREFEPVPPGDIARYVNYPVVIKPRGQPEREGVLKRITEGSAEVEQSVHGGKFTVYVALDEIESMQALVQREVGSRP
ncbi:MAG: hypothetical protein H6953_06305 [Chromatiaceae bacterium]|nr:hypothetical protein [Chromatiaceae bacterium]MCP5314998.1 hypothetical protein [Chromatiaceae bacterium]